MANGITYEVMYSLGKIIERSDDWSTELNVVSWNEGRPKFDIRAWSKDHKQMTRGITLFPEEFEKLVHLYLAKKSEAEEIMKARA